MGHTGPKAVQVSFNNGEELPEIEELIKKHNVDRVTRYLQQLSHLTREMKFQQSSYLHVSERRRSMLASTNKRVSFWSIVEIMSVVGVSALQILFLKRMFSRRQRAPTIQYVMSRLECPGPVLSLTTGFGDTSPQC
eukprot:Plantae.Rhodophyta-Rhodochaete_pulchella.ctg2322.p2 GENE.Plantae.Rhodophyta-Rhodochaete_pulchella.ctg2322~~Plantae.Rhodophyta-Rhodochaete_pulchella.ctg2322.p2  ORF type:complete len:136 (-),score=17.92 Plantae.Rhodophyta-Rhodochaete_pulchella.ctg2322:17-424(-)